MSHSTQRPPTTEAPRNSTAMEEYTPEEMTEILAKIQEIAKTLQKVEEIIGHHRKSSRVQEPIAESAGSESPEEMLAEPDNVYYICPHIVSDFKLIQGNGVDGATYPMTQLIELFGSWSESLYAASVLNSQHLFKANGNKALRKHLIEGYRVCKNLSSVFEKGRTEED